MIFIYAQELKNAIVAQVFIGMHLIVSYKNLLCTNFYAGKRVGCGIFDSITWTINSDVCF